VKSITGGGGRPFRDGEKAEAEPKKSAKVYKAIVRSAYSQNEFHHNPPKGFVATKGSVTVQELPVYPGMDVFARPLFCLFDQEDFQPSLS
jgi:hypothetical protein